VAGLRGLKGASSTDAYCRTSDTLNLLKALVQQAPGGETTTGVIVIAGSLSQAGSSNSTSGGTCTVTQDQYTSMAGIIAGARANMYVVQGDSAVGRDSGMENLAGVTGAGSVMRVANEGFAPRVLSETSTYWVATLAPDPADKPNQSQRLELKSVKEGVTIRHASGSHDGAHGQRRGGCAGGSQGRRGRLPRTWSSRRHRSRTCSCGLMAWYCAAWATR
jgi:hypothetical protein